MASGLSFRADIQGLRAIAVLAVMLFHYDRTLLPGGFVGVDIFFVISGYLITSILLKQKSNFSLLTTLKTFYLGRIKRIAPAYYCLLLVVSIISAIIFIPTDFLFFRNSLKSSLLFTSNNYFAGFGDYFAPKSDEVPLLHTWSLAIEMQFYLFYPFLVLLLGKKWLKIIIPSLIILLLTLSTYQLSKDLGQEIYYGLYARVPEFLMGGCIVLFAAQLQHMQSNYLSIIGCVLIFASFLFIHDKTPFPGIYALPSVLGVSLILGNVSNNKISKYLSIFPLTWIGTISYSLYLWHWPFLAFMRYISGEYQLNFFQSVLYWGGAYMLASASYYCIEQWFRSNKTTQLNIRSWGIIISLVILSTLFSSNINKNIVPPLPVELTRYADPATICHGKTVGDCIRGDRNSSKKPILVLGDSHAAMLNYFFDVVGQKSHLSFRVITASSCIPIKNFDYKRISAWAHDECIQQMATSEKNLGISTDAVIISALWNYHLESDSFKKALIGFLEDNRDKKILVLTDIPSLSGYNPIREQRFNSLGISHNKPTFDLSIQKTQILKSIVARYENVKYLDLITQNSLFTSGAIHNGTILYYDQNHLNEVGSRLYANSSYSKLQPYLDWLINQKSSHEK